MKNLKAIIEIVHNMSSKIQKPLTNGCAPFNIPLTNECVPFSARQTDYERNKLKPHVLPDDAEEFMKAMESIDDKHKKLHEIGREFLGSSYFMERTHGYKKWKASLGKSTT